LSKTTSGAIARRHDLDALRAIAMLLGIALHVGLGYVPGWIITDDGDPRMLHKTSDSFQLMFNIIHGFRMPLFFLVSGFFTAMLWRKRGVNSLLKHRYARIFIPCMLGLIFIQSMEDAVGRWRGEHDRKFWEEHRQEMTLMEASWRQDRGLIEELLNKGADINQKDDDGFTPLMAVSQMRRQDLVERLAVRGADVELKNNAGITAKQIAREVGHEGIVDFFERERVARKMDIWDATAHEDRRMMHWRLAVNPEVVNQLHPKTGETPLQVAMATGEWERVADLFDRGADLRLKNGEGESPLEWLDDSTDSQMRFFLEMGNGLHEVGSGTLPAGEHFFERIRAHDTGRLRRLILSGVNPNSVNAEHGYSALAYAAATGKYGVVEMLLNHGADVNARSKDGSTALHAAAMFSRHGELKLLKRFEVDESIENEAGLTAAEVAAAPFTAETRDGLMTLAAAFDIGVSPEGVKGRRDEAARILGTEPRPGPPHDEIFGDWDEDDFWEKFKKNEKEEWDQDERRGKQQAGVVGQFKDWYWQQVNEAKHYKDKEGRWQNLFHQSGFGHFWFLWFLVWLVAMFAVYAVVCDLVGIKRMPKWLVVSKLRYLYLIPLTLIPTLVMHSQFGPDTSTHWGPQPHMLVYYFIFFLFGAWYFDADDSEGKLGRFWWLTIPLSVVLYLAFGTQDAWLMAGLEEKAWLLKVTQVGWLGAEPYQIKDLLIRIASVTYVWLMTFGWMGLFRKVLSKESKVMRYVSDSSYWLYVAHMPLVVLYIQMLKPLDWHPWVKFTVVCSLITVSLLVTYQLFVRHTLIGEILNGKRKPKVKSES
jgi:ankyrin repeat protein/fucose 4-O-acetylase-like acetyltransferase